MTATGRAVGLAGNSAPPASGEAVHLTVESSGRIAFASPGAGALFGWAADELVGQTVSILVPVRYRAHHERSFDQFLATAEPSFQWRGIQLPALHRDGSEFPVEVVLGGYEADGARFLTATISGLNENPGAPPRAAASEQYYRQLFESNVAGVYRVGIDGRVHDVNEAMARMLGYTIEELEGLGAHNVYFDVTDRDDWLRRVLDKGSLTNFVLKLRRKDGTHVWTLENCSMMRDPATGERTILGTAIDITERKALEEQLERMAYHDPLTGLPNRRMLQVMANKAIARAGREGQTVALLYVDLVRFKRINDVLGHSAGDQVLREVARRFGAFVRATDTLARVGGDEFALLLVSAGTSDAALAPAKKIRESLARPFLIDGQTFHLDARVGIAAYPEHAINFDELLSHADLALHQTAVADGEIAVYRPMEIRHSREDLVLEERFRAGLRNSEFELHYQPIFRLPGREPIGTECLTRWVQADGKRIDADRFISIAEQTGLIRQLDRWALRAALIQLRAWASDDLASPQWVALNLTPSTFDDIDFPTIVRTALEEAGVDGRKLALEVTERLTMRDPERAARILHELRELGLRIVIDDFGRGHSSLEYLKDFPVDAIKIDRAFVGRVGEDRTHERLVEGIIALAAGLGIDLIAEGVESAAQLEWLERHHCGYAQGYHLVHPLPAHLIPDIFAGYTTGSKAAASSK
ncbi:MAG TPA: bifunctional diguanylate cyclase/phosphodiesterase [Longimicrobiales bacterium]|nr:bifunctional diguanylate cyclase/phosphodiesterase [Longimicrobiales bacterium]